MDNESLHIAPTQQNETIRKLAVDRIIELEKELKSYGYRPRFGIEVEFFVNGEKGKPVKLTNEKLSHVTEELKKSRYVEDLREENVQRGWTSSASLAAMGGAVGIVGGAITGEPISGLIGFTVGVAGAIPHAMGMTANWLSGSMKKHAQYEINLGDTKAGEERTITKADGSEKTVKRGYALGALKSAIATEWVQQKLREELADVGTVDFTAKPRNDNLTSACHINFSLIDENGNNAYKGKMGTPSETMRRNLAEMTRVHRDASLLFLPSENSHERVHHGGSTPERIGISSNKLTHKRFSPSSSISARYAGITGGLSDALHGTHTPAASTRGETRISGADIDPYLATVATLSAMVTAVRKEKEGIGEEKPIKAPLPKNLHESIQRFTKSDYMKDMLGEELHAAISEHYQKVDLKQSMAASQPDQTRPSL